MIMRPPIKYALGHEGVSETDTKRVYCNSIVTNWNWFWERSLFDSFVDACVA